MSQGEEGSNQNFTSHENLINDHIIWAGRRHKTTERGYEDKVGLIFNIDKIPYYKLREYIGNWINILLEPYSYYH